MMRIVLILLLAVFVSCNNIVSNNTSAKDSGTAATESDTIKAVPPKTDFTGDSVIVIKFQRDSSSIKIAGKINGINKPVVVYIPVTKGKQLTVSLVPEDSVANIRINQIFTPDGKADGPFGRDLTRKISEEGTYKLVIAEDLMQGDEWKGRFWLTVKII